VAPQGLLHLSAADISMRSCTELCGGHLQRFKLWFGLVYFIDELIQSQAV
jgi:hypothetical protein